MKADVIVIGGGISGLSAALFTGHAGLKTIVFDAGESQIKKVAKLNNVLGAPGVSGDELLEKYRQQLGDFAEVKSEKVDFLQKEGDTFIVKANGATYEAVRVIIATNVDTALLEAIGLEIAVNENIKSGKIKKVVGVNWEGVTSVPNLYIAGLLTDLPSQVMIAAGQGAAVGVRVAQDATGDKYMWHDVN
ncbi:NAD(P)/FAD-dependent oxidoreductase [Bacillus benzoevorans]|uniref:Thioredoxin reductase n=1 Tax=Bacillus benzoevorans TaxID=1456 RepID=A0A7X0LUV4_9BACI|nr:NAD(P)/FAD-dependent oxidoreductase [Bacillus benzoevorans]MBB6445346.1 thioredoxin reductase [Bacillus benzoevorans]